MGEVTTSFPRYEELVEKSTWKPRPDYVDESKELSYVITDSDLDGKVSLVAQAKIQFHRRKTWSGNLYCYLTNKTWVEFPKTWGYHGEGVFDTDGKRIAVFTSSRSKMGPTLRFYDVKQPEQYREIQIPKAYKYVGVALDAEGPFRVLVEDADKKRHHMVWVGADQSASWTGEGAVAFSLKNIPVLFNPKALKPDNVLNTLGYVAVAAIFVGFLVMRKS